MEKLQDQVVLIIYNPYSASGKNKKIEQKLSQVYRSFGVSSFVLSIKELDEIVKYIKTCNIHHITIVGGDGTINIVINHLLQLDVHVPLNLYPGGTSNDFAMLLGISKHVRKNVYNALHSQPAPVDLGIVNNRYFVNIAAAGTFTTVSQRVNQEMKRYLGKIAYFIKGIDEWSHPIAYHGIIESEEFHYEGIIYILLVMNGKTTGNYRLPLHSSYDDGLLDVVVVESVKLRKVISNFLRFYMGNYNCKDIHYFQTKSFTVHSNRQLPTDVDGEPGETFPLHFRCAPRKIQILGVKK